METDEGVARDPRYYFFDGAVLLVGNVLFKIHISRLAQHSTAFDGILASQNSPQSDFPDRPGSSDDHPVVVQGVDPEAFRSLLVMFYGIICDPLYQSFISDASNEAMRNCETFKRYLDIAVLCQRFGMEDLETWAHKQFKLVLSSPERLAGLSWDPNLLLTGLAYAKGTLDAELERDIRNLICCHLQLRSGWLSGTPITQHINRTILQLYQDPELKTTDPMLFGFAFCSVLSLGHKSSVWKDLSQDDRTKLMVAQVYLTPLPRTALHLGWVYRSSDLAKTIGSKRATECSSDCANRFTSVVFRKAFTSEYIKRLESDAPLVGISALRELPRLRRDIASTLKTEDMSWEIEEECLRHVLVWLDEKINTTFTVLSDSYHNKVY